MQRQLKKFGVFCLLAWLAYTSSAFAEGVAKRHFIMGGAGDNLRAISKQDTDTTFNVYLADLYKEYGAGWTLSVVIYPDSPALLNAFDSGEIDGYFGTPLDYLARKDKLCKTMAAMRYRLAPIEQPLLLVARADDGIMKINDLKGKRLSMSPYQEMEALYLNTELLRNQLPEIPVFFGERKEVKSVNFALMELFFNRSDVTIVRENEFNIAAELNPQLKKKLIVLKRSAPLFTILGVMGNRVSEQDFSDFFDKFNTITRTNKGKKLMSLVQVEDVIKVLPDNLRGVEDLLNERDALRKLNAMAPRKGYMLDGKPLKRNAQ